MCRRGTSANKVNDQSIFFNSLRPFKHKTVNEQDGYIYAATQIAGFPLNNTSGIIQKRIFRMVSVLNVLPNIIRISIKEYDK